MRETGGLYDTIKPYDSESGEGNGITFYSYNAHDMLSAIDRAKMLYHDREKWSGLVSNVMAADFSWDRSAREYIKMYEEI